MTALTSLLQDEIARLGPMPFARFMALALYHPEHGYYERDRDPVGRAGDFYTSVSVGSLFGELLAWRFAGWLESTRAESVELIEAGAHDGKLAADILGWLRAERPALAERLRYTIIEPSARRQRKQAERLSGVGNRVRWRHDLPAGGAGGAAVIFSNELLDAFPVHRVGWDAPAKCWFEWGVEMSGSGLGWTRLALAESMVSQVPRSLAAGTDWGDAELAALLDALPDGFTLELNLAAEAWWSRAAQALSQGWLVTLDYGFAAGEVVRPERTQGTLRAYRGHTVSEALLASPGAQDLTAHVNFPALQAAGEAAGLRTIELCRQEQFLTRITAELPCAWTPERTRQLRTLVHPAHLGRAFRVLVQARNGAPPGGPNGPAVPGAMTAPR